MTTPQQVRDYMQEKYGTDHGVSDDALQALIERAVAHRRALGYGSIQVMASRWVREAAGAPPDA